MRRLRYLVAAVLVAGSFSAVNVAVAGADSGSGGSCVDHADNGQGNLGDPGNGGNHHNESNGKGNLGDPGNAGNKQCSSDF